MGKDRGKDRTVVVSVRMPAEMHSKITSFPIVKKFGVSRFINSILKSHISLLRKTSTKENLYNLDNIMMFVKKSNPIVIRNIWRADAEPSVWKVMLGIDVKPKKWFNTPKVLWDNGMTNGEYAIISKHGNYYFLDYTGGSVTIQHLWGLLNKDKILNVINPEVLKKRRLPSKFSHILYFTMLRHLNILSLEGARIYNGLNKIAVELRIPYGLSVAFVNLIPEISRVFDFGGNAVSLNVMSEIINVEKGTCYNALNLFAYLGVIKRYKLFKSKRTFIAPNKDVKVEEVMKKVKEINDYAEQKRMRQLYNFLNTNADWLPDDKMSEFLTKPDVYIEWRDE